MTESTSKKVRLFFSAKGLKDLDTFSKSDPYLVLQSVNNGRVTEVGRTEIIMNDLNPVWKTSITVPYYFESRQSFRAVIYDDDGHAADSKNDLAGKIDFLLSKVVCARGRTKTFDLDTKGTVTVTYEDVGGSAKDQLSLELYGRNLKSMGTFGTSPFLVILRLLPNGTKHEIYRTEVKDGLSPQWKATKNLPVCDLHGGDPEAKTLEVQCWGSRSVRGDVSLGYFQCSVGDLKRAAVPGAGVSSGPGFKLIKDKNKASSFYGEIFVGKLNAVEFPPFTAYLSSGWQINLVASIDFTGSNGNPRQPTSLHYMNPQQPNQYVQAIMSVGDILMEYDTDKMVPVFGFGASIAGRTEHFFHVNRKADPYVHGVQGILDTYGAFLPTCILSGPTNFAPTIIAATKGARESERERVYTILLIITDGEITDMDATVDAIVDADDAPLSIVIVGVGKDCDFMNMDELDGDDVQLRSSRGKISRRDLVQFVPYRDFIKEPHAKLAAAVLEEVPDQFEIYARLRGVPDPRIAQ